eukprot:COSAG03_NODE_10840_length_626_cov_0.669829_1_plen_51_part_10
MNSFVGFIVPLVLRVTLDVNKVHTSGSAYVFGGIRVLAEFGDALILPRIPH